MKTKSLIIKISPELHDVIARQAKKRGSTIKGFVTFALAQADPEVRKVWNQELDK